MTKPKAAPQDKQHTVHGSVEIREQELLTITASAVPTPETDAEYESIRRLTDEGLYSFNLMSEFSSSLERRLHEALAELKIQDDANEILQHRLGEDGERANKDYDGLLQQNQWLSGQLAQETAKREEAERKLSEAEKDAKRYRWALNNNVFDYDQWPHTFDWRGILDLGDATSADIDAALDKEKPCSKQA
jgi:hypothetical protein